MNDETLLTLIQGLVFVSMKPRISKQRYHNDNKNIIV